MLPTSNPHATPVSTATRSPVKPPLFLGLLKTKGRAHVLRHIFRYPNVSCAAWRITRGEWGLTRGNGGSDGEKPTGFVFSTLWPRQSTPPP